jgi:hypothetical protein
MIAKGRVDFNRIVQHVTEIFRKKLNYFKLNIGQMERIIMIMLSSATDNKHLDCLSNKIEPNYGSRETSINFCNKCFKGHLCVSYNNKKGWRLKCDECNNTINCCTGAIRVQKITESKNEKPICRECGSNFVNVLYKDQDQCPFPPGQMSHTGCILCDTYLRSTIKSVFKSAAPKLMTAAEKEELEKVRE